MKRYFFIYKSRMPWDFQPGVHLKILPSGVYVFNRENSHFKVVVGEKEDLGYNSRLCLASFYLCN